ncbi:MAG: hypothetical protein H7836_17570 [Magnetococcus sp. YQC-3]
MGERFWITGVQLGLLQGLQLTKQREALVKEIVKNQFIGDKEDLVKLLKAKK